MKIVISKTEHEKVPQHLTVYCQKILPSMIAPRSILDMPVNIMHGIFCTFRCPFSHLVNRIPNIRCSGLFSCVLPSHCLADDANSHYSRRATYYTNTGWHRLTTAVWEPYSKQYKIQMTVMQNIAVWLKNCLNDNSGSKNLHIANRITTARLQWAGHNSFIKTQCITKFNSFVFVGMEGEQSSLDRSQEMPPILFSRWA